MSVAVNLEAAREELSSRDAAAAPACLYCGGDEFAPLYRGVRDRLGHVAGEWSFVRCRECGSAQLRPFPRTEDLSAFYPPVYTFSPELAHSPLKRLLSGLEYRLFFRPMYRAQARLVDRHVRPRRQQPGRLLDIGCGRGLRLVEFRRLGYDVHGMDFVPDAVDYVQTTLGIPAVCTDATHLAEALEPESFDVITAFHVIEHITELDATLAAAWQLLKPGGWLAISGPLFDSAQSFALGRRWTAVTEAPRHVTIPTSKGLHALLARTGFLPHRERAIPDPALACAALIPQSLFPQSAATSAYGSGRWLATAVRSLAAMATFVAWPLAAVENHVLGMPAQGLFLARRPSIPTDAHTAP